MRKNFFLKTVYEKSRPRVRPLPGQFLDSETISGVKPVAIDDSKNVSCDKHVRSLVPIGTILVTTSLTQKGSFYQAGDLATIEDLTEKGVPQATKEQIKEYEDLVGGKAPTSEPTKESSIKRRSVFGKIMGDKDLQPPKVEEGFYVDPDVWYVLTRNIQKQVPTMLVGPTGSGKTELVQLICNRLDLDCRISDMGSMLDPIAGLLGVHRLNKDGVSEFDYAKFTTDIASEGVVLLDELSRAPVTTNNILFPCLDSRKYLPVDIAGGHDTRKIKVHENCSFISTANVGGEYTGTNSMDAALVSRFFMIELDYMPEDMEKRVVQSRCGLDTMTASMVVKISNDIRSLHRKGEISNTVSTREVLQASDLIKDGFPTLKALEFVFLPLFEGTKSEGERNTVNNILISK